jgi:hypothetical protein
MARSATSPEKPSPPKKTRKPAAPTATKQKPPAASTPAEKPARKRAAKPSPPKNTIKTPQVSTRQRILLSVAEGLGLCFSLLSCVVVALGFAAGRFSGSNFFAHLLPFTLGVGGVILLLALLILGWLRLRRWLGQRWPFMPAALALMLALVIGTLSLRGDFFLAVNQFRILVGGKEEAARVTLTHQIFAAYRRLESTPEQQLIDRSPAFATAIDAAAAHYRLDPDLLRGLAATESSFLPRDSKDGGKGLFQITLVPQPVLQEVAAHLRTEKVDLTDHHHNALVAAATFAHYLQQMKGDLFLGLLAYNIGPKNGGLRFIMQQYGATDFITIQPYLQQLPRDYPIRVLSHALAFRLYRAQGKLPAYEEGLNAVRIQNIGIPGLTTFSGNRVSTTLKTGSFP